MVYIYYLLNTNEIWSNVFELISVLSRLAFFLLVMIFVEAIFEIETDQTEGRTPCKDHQTKATTRRLLK